VRAFARKTAAIVGLVGALLAAQVPAAHATIFATGTCVLKFAFNFSGGSVGPGLLTHPSFSMTVTNDSVDFSPDAITGWSGTQPCGVVDTSGVTNTARNTTITSAGGSSSVWTCGAVVAGGTFHQSWATRGGQSDPPAADMSFGLDGTWGAWEVNFASVTSSPLVEGVIHLTADPTFATEASACATNGVNTIHMIGVEAFNDPQL
jgi:hypothetical protein